MWRQCLFFVTITILLFLFIYSMFSYSNDGHIVYDGGFFKIMQPNDGAPYLQIYDDGGPYRVEVGKWRGE